MLKLYVVRHGQSESNVTGVYSGWGRFLLTEKGFADAAGAGALLKDIPFEQVYSSDQERAVQTCQTALPGVSFEQTPLLREVNVGSISGITPARAEELYGEAHRQRIAVRDFSDYGGETTTMQYDRAVQFMKTFEQGNVNGNVAVFCHEGTVKCMLRYVLQAEIAWSRFYADNGSVAIFSWNGEAWKLEAWNLVK